MSVATPQRLCLDATPGPPTIAAWRGKGRRPTLPVAWLERGKTYAGYDLMGLNGNDALMARLSPELCARMQGKTCFNFQKPNAQLFAELYRVTADSRAALRRGGFVAVAGNASP